ncbi:MAG: TM2 domain-containing protein [Ruminococcus flavefaciens]|nr:TM2 domain-containing protein [Ruminococcus flavefaciens]MCM1228606.1 TM2 domain-containing protein [Ruminococcus flavefaciens]
MEIQTNQSDTPTKFCKHCGAKIPVDAVICTACGRQVENLVNQNQPQPQIVINNSSQSVSNASAVNKNTNINGGRVYIKGKAKNKWVAFCLCLFLGFFGAHKFYEGNTKMGIIYLCTVGLLGIGWIIDIIILLTKPNPYYV